MEEVRKRLDEKDAEIQQIEESLRLERAKSAQLEDQLDKQVRATNQECQRAETEKGRMEQERDKRMEMSLALDKANRLHASEMSQRELLEEENEELQSKLSEVSQENSKAQEALQKATEEVNQLRSSIKAAESEKAAAESRSRAPSDSEAMKAEMATRSTPSDPFADNREEVQAPGSKPADDDETRSQMSATSRGVSGMLGRGTGSSKGVAHGVKGIFSATSKLLSPFGAGRHSPSAGEQTSPK